MRDNKGTFTAILLAALMIFLVILSQGAFASAASSPEDPPYNVERDNPAGDISYQECGQECLYQRDSEVKTSQLLYHTNHIFEMEHKLGTDPKERKSKLPGVIAANEGVLGFCNMIGYNNGLNGNVSAESCFEMYKLTVRDQLYKVRAGFLKDQDSISELDSPVVEIDRGDGKIEKRVAQQVERSDGDENK
ncbi:MAG: hypothetical protein KDD43_17075, partial [Bdellovibrionales bacterium]|nr:hypothetical protein [Bdellovibrionales bacterium]